MSGWSLTSDEFYRAIAEYMQRVDPSWVEEWMSPADNECEKLQAVLGQAEGQRVLDCSCGNGGQAIPLAKLGWQVTATDTVEACLDTARSNAAREAVSIDFQVCDMRQVSERFGATFDWVVCCCALDNLTEDTDIQRAVASMHDVLKPGGKCFISLRNFDEILRTKPRYEVKEERRLAHGRVLRIEDWEYESETHLVYIQLFLQEDEQRKTSSYPWPFGWQVEAFGLRRRALRRAQLEQHLQQAGFQGIEHIPQAEWKPYEFVAGKPLNSVF